MRWDEKIRPLLAGDAPVELIKARIPACLTATALNAEMISVNIILEDGKIAALMPSHQSTFTGLKIDLEEGMILPAFTDIHTHLDKGHILPRMPNPDGTFIGALESVGEDREENWSAQDVRARMEFSLKCAYHHGTAAIRTHLDSMGPQAAISWPVFGKIRDEWQGRIELQAVSLFGIEALADPTFLPRLLPYILENGGILGAVAYKVPGLDDYLDTLFQTAAKHDLTLDFHADENGDPASDCLLKIAEAALRNKFDGSVLVGHCCSLARQDKATLDRTLDQVAEAGLGIVSLPLCNMYLQDRLYDETGHALTPRWRGVTVLHEMKARGIPVMVASDNNRDPFYAYGDMDMLEVYREATRILHLDHPVADWPLMMTTVPSTFGDFQHRAFLEDEAPADFIISRARSFSELLSRPQSDRIVVRSGKALSSPLPDYRDLDNFVGLPGLKRKNLPHGSECA